MISQQSVSAVSAHDGSPEFLGQGIAQLPRLPALPLRGTPPQQVAHDQAASQVQTIHIHFQLARKAARSGMRYKGYDH